MTEAVTGLVGVMLGASLSLGGQLIVWNRSRAATRRDMAVRAFSDWYARANEALALANDSSLKENDWIKMKDNPDVDKAWVRRRRAELDDLLQRRFRARRELVAALARLRLEARLFRKQHTASSLTDAIRNFPSPTGETGNPFESWLIANFRKPEDYELPGDGFLFHARVMYRSELIARGMDAFVTELGEALEQHDPINDGSVP